MENNSTPSEKQKDLQIPGIPLTEGNLKHSDILKTQEPETETIPEYTCTIKQFAQFVGASESLKQKIVKGQKDYQEVPFFWHQSASSAIVKSLKENNIGAVHKKIATLKKDKKDGVQKDHNRILSIMALEKYAECYLPLNFRLLKKQIIVPEKNYIDFYGIRIKITPDLVFKGFLEGKEVIGAVKISIKKTKPKPKDKVILYLLYKYLNTLYFKPEEVVKPDLCLLIEPFEKKITPATSHTLAPHLLIKQECTDFKRRWNSL